VGDEAPIVPPIWTKLHIEIGVVGKLSGSGCPIVRTRFVELRDDTLGKRRYGNVNIAIVACFV
jgi:hypothetical protein